MTPAAGIGRRRLAGLRASNTMVIRGLQRYGQHALAARLARSYYACVAEVFQRTGTFWENYAPDAVQAGKPAKPDFCGWSAIAPIALMREFIAPDRKVFPDAIY